jgi:hypothetical protein
MTKYKRLVKHKREARDETKAFSKNTGRVVYKYGDGAVKKQSVLNGEMHTFNKKGREIKNRIVLFKVF